MANQVHPFQVCDIEDNVEQENKGTHSEASSEGKSKQSIDPYEHQFILFASYMRRHQETGDIQSAYSQQSLEKWIQLWKVVPPY